MTRRILVGLAVAAACGPATADAAELHVRAGAPAGGNGTPSAPFASLAEVQAGSAPGDTIVVERATAALDGGIVLKPGQRLEGAHTGDGEPLVTNTKGDAVTLADGTTVTGLVIRGPARGGMYGLDSVGVTIAGNDVSGHNTSCAAGFTVQPFNVPTGVPFVGGGVAGNGTLAPQNGWAGIMVDGSRASGSVVIEGNAVHDGK